MPIAHWTRSTAQLGQLTGITQWTRCVQLKCQSKKDYFISKQAKVHFNERKKKKKCCECV